MRVAVLGAGVNGLSCAHELLSAGHQVTLFFSRPPMNTTSAIATAMWHVYLVDPNDARNISWATETLSRLLALADIGRSSGVYLVEGVELFRSSPRVEPAWSNVPPMFEMLTRPEIRRYAGVQWGYRISAPLAEMDTYLPWLYREVWSLGADMRSRSLLSLDELGRDWDLIVNCAGLGAKKLVGDEELQPVRGQYLILEKPKEAGDTYLGDDENPAGMAYVIPRRSDVLIGGTEEYGVELLDFQTSIDGMIRRCSELVPWLRARNRVAVREMVVGLRPWRPSGVRLEYDMTAGGVPVIHNYGHGGSGFSLSWGCARTVATMAADL